MGAGRKQIWHGVRAILSATAFLAWQAELAQAHTVSIGYTSDAPGDLTFWLGTYHSGVNYTEGSLRLVGSGFSATVPFTILDLVRPAGLVDGTNNFYSNGTMLVGNFAASAYASNGPVQAWQGAGFTGLRAGTYTFTYIPITNPTQVWQPEDSVILSYTVDLSGALLGGTQVSPFATNANQRSVGGALDAAIAAGATNAGLTALGSMSSSQITNALDQISGESAAGARQAAMQTLNPFLTMMIDPFVADRGTAFGAAALGFAPEREQLPPDIAQAYASLTRAQPAATAQNSGWSVWGSPFGGQSQINGNADLGSHDTAVRTAGIASGFDYRFSPATVAGFALAGGTTSWGLAEGLGGGRSDVFQAGVYGTTKFGAAYLSASFAAAIHAMSTNRSVGISGANMSANFDAVNYGGRVEGGYRYDLPAVGITPYAAVQAQAFRSPSYSETSSNGVNDFALAYNSGNATDTRTEIGSWFDRTFLLEGDKTLVLRSRAAWAHDWVSGTAVNAVFQSIPTSGFIVNGATTAPDSGLVSLAADLKFGKGLSFGVKFDGQFASNMQTYTETATLRYQW